MLAYPFGLMSRLPSGADKSCELNVLKSTFKELGEIGSFNNNNPVGTLISFESADI